MLTRMRWKSSVPLPEQYPVKKNAVYLPYDRELPSEVIERIIIRSFDPGADG